MKPTILTCAVVGSGPMRKDNPAIPTRPPRSRPRPSRQPRPAPTIAHIHVRHPETGAASMELQYYRETVNRIRDSGTDIILNLTTGPGARFDPRAGRSDPAWPGAPTSPRRSGAANMWSN